MKFIKQTLFFFSIIITSQSYSQSTWLRMELDVKQMLNPSCNLNMGDLDSNKVYVHLGLCTCMEQSPFGPENRDCSDPSQNELFCTTQITPFQSRVWQHVVGNWGSTPQDDGVGLMTYEGDSVWSMELIVEDYFSDLNLVQDTAMGNDSSIAYHSGLIPYTIGVVFRDKDGFFSGRDNGCNDIFITGLKNGNLPTYRDYMNTTRKNNSSMITALRPAEIASVYHQKEEKLKNLKKKKRRYQKKTIKRTYKIGRSRIKPQISVLVSNKTMRNNILEKKQMLNQVPIQDIRRYLIKHGFIKVGSNTPNDVLRQMYISAMMVCGEIQNHNEDNLMYNFLYNQEN